MADSLDGAAGRRWQRVRGGGPTPVVLCERGRADPHAHGATARVRVVRGELPPQPRGAGRAGGAAIRAGPARQRHVAGAAAGARGGARTGAAWWRARGHPRAGGLLPGRARAVARGQRAGDAERRRPFVRRLPGIQVRVEAPRARAAAMPRVPARRRAQQRVGACPAGRPAAGPVLRPRLAALHARGRASAVPLRAAAARAPLARPAGRAPAVAIRERVVLARAGPRVPQVHVCPAAPPRAAPVAAPAVHRSLHQRAARARPAAGLASGAKGPECAAALRRPRLDGRACGPGPGRGAQRSARPPGRLLSHSPRCRPQSFPRQP
ncbi:FAGR062Cp [Eremothecium gossypii FDAG1]|nr:FAGR062Cp [Eremothecium gossypii FDAG1]